MEDKLFTLTETIDQDTFEKLIREVIKPDTGILEEAQNLGPGFTEHVADQIHMVIDCKRRGVTYLSNIFTQCYSQLGMSIPEIIFMCVYAAANLNVSTLEVVGDQAGLNRRDFIRCAPIAYDMMMQYMKDKGRREGTIPKYDN